MKCQLLWQTQELLVFITNVQCCCLYFFSCDCFYYIFFGFSVACTLEYLDYHCYLILQIHRSSQICTNQSKELTNESWKVWNLFIIFYFIYFHYIFNIKCGFLSVCNNLEGYLFRRTLMHEFNNFKSHTEWYFYFFSWWNSPSSLAKAFSIKN